MKVKSDFVTNSSAMAFVFWGITKYPSEVEDLFKEQIEKDEDFLYSREFEDLCSNIGIKVSTWHDGEISFIGLPPNEMKEDETLRQFKERILKGLQHFYPDLTYEDIGYIEEASSNY